MKMNVDLIQLDPDNAMKHPKKSIASIGNSLKRFGQQKPIVIDKNNIVRAGNGTLQAAKELGWAEVWVHKSNLSGKEMKAYALADNKTSELSDWDKSVLDQQLMELKMDGFEMPDFGFKHMNLFDVSGAGDEVPEVEENEFGVELGDVWELGNHRLICGDSTDKDTVDRLLDGAVVDMVFTDPPYGISIVKNDKVGGSVLAKNTKFKEIEGDNDINVAIAALDVLKDFKNKIIWGGNYYADHLPNSSCWVVWDKREGLPSNNFADCELAWTDFKKPARIYRQAWMGMIRKGESEKRVHPTQKPVALAEWCFVNYGEPKIVLDIFLGSGSTLIACEKTKRKCYGVELDPHYCSVIIKRWQEFTGEVANRLKTV